MQAHRHRQIEAAILVRIAVLVEELAKTTDKQIQDQRRRDQAILWNNTFAHNHRDLYGATIGTDREEVPKFLGAPSESDIPKQLTKVFADAHDVEPAITFGISGDKKKKLVGIHWDKFCGHKEIKEPQPPLSQIAGSPSAVNKDAASDADFMKNFLGDNFLKSETKKKDPESDPE